MPVDLAWRRQTRMSNLALEIRSWCVAMLRSWRTVTPLFRLGKLRARPVDAPERPEARKHTQRCSSLVYFVISEVGRGELA